MAMLGLGLASTLVLPVAFVDVTTALGALAATIALLLSLRVHLRVSERRATLVRTVLCVPWFATTRGPGAVGAWTDWDFDGDDLVLPLPPGAPARAVPIVVLTTSLHGVRPDELYEIGAAAEALLPTRPGART